jgi:hypothetical protein
MLMKAGATIAHGQRRLAVLLGHPGACPILLALSVGALLPLVIPGLRTEQVVLSVVLLAGAVTAAFTFLLRHRPRGWRLLLRLTAGVAIAFVCAYSWYWADFLTACRDHCLWAGRELVVVVDGDRLRYYIYQHDNVPDGSDGTEIMERYWGLRRSVWRSRSPARVERLFDGRVLRLGSHLLHLYTSGPALRASIDGTPARVLSVPLP